MHTVYIGGMIMCVCVCPTVHTSHKCMDLGNVCNVHWQGFLLPFLIPSHLPSFPLPFTSPLLPSLYQERRDQMLEMDERKETEWIEIKQRIKKGRGAFGREGMEGREDHLWHMCSVAYVIQPLSCLHSPRCNSSRIFLCPLPVQYL